MIITLFIYIAAFLLGTLATVSKVLTGNFQLPTKILDSFTYFFTKINTYDFILNTSELLIALVFLVKFIVLYFGVKLLFKIYNWVRGSGSIDV